MFDVELVSGKRFTASNNETLLDAAERAGVNLNYSCKTGRCGACKCKVLKGLTASNNVEMGLTDQEKNEGMVLSCVREAKSDLIIEADDLGSMKLPAPKTFPCRISQIDYLTQDVVRIILRLPPAVDFNFIPGQYIDVIGANGIRRSYSVANARAADKVLELYIRNIENGVMSQYWFNNAKVNDLLRLHGPLGTFFLRKTANVDLIFLATGTGIAPVKAMLETIAQLPAEQQPKSVTFYWGGRNTRDFFLDMASICGLHTYVAVQSRPCGDWVGARGHVQAVLLDLDPDLTNTTVYACGSEKMIHDANKCLVQSGLQPDRFYSDVFVCSG